MEHENSIYRDDNRLGYSKEEDYFNRMNRILGNNLKSEVHCPACEGRSTPVLRDGLIINRCTKCHNEFQNSTEAKAKFSLENITKKNEET
jgi:ribosomal protein L37AE/L43A